MRWLTTGTGTPRQTADPRTLDLPQRLTAATAVAPPWHPRCPRRGCDVGVVRIDLSRTALADEYRTIDAAFRPRANTKLTFDPTRHDPAILERARKSWAASASVEYNSATTFIEMAVGLRSLGDPVDVQAVALRLAQDELRHAIVCADVVRAMGGDAVFAGPNEDQMGPHADCGPEENALRSVIFGCCLSEMVSAARLAKRYAETGDGFVREAYRSLLADERLHAQFGFFYLEYRRDWLRDRPELRRSLARYLQFAFAALEHKIGAVPADASPASAEERALGLPDMTDLSATYQETIANATVPALEGFGIDAEKAWRTRSLAP
jgi:hypothetical protein